MDKTNDELQTLNYSIQSLGSQINESNTRITALQQAAKRLVSKEEYDELCQVLPEPHEEEEIACSDADYERKLVQELEKERLETIMEIQKQEFITDKLVELNEQNGDIIESFKEFYQHKDEIRNDEELITSERLHFFKDFVMDPKIAKLESNIKALNQNIEKVQSFYGNRAKSIDLENATLQSDEFQQQLDSLISKLNSVFHQFVTDEQTVKIT